MISRPQRISYIFMLVVLLLVGWLHMATLLLTTLFGYLALRTFSLGRSRVLAVTLFSVMVVGVSFGVLHFGKKAYLTVPNIVDNTLPILDDIAHRFELDIPFDNYKELIEFLKKESIGQYPSMENFKSLQGFLSTLIFQLVYLIIGSVVAVSLFFNSKISMDSDPHSSRDSLYAMTAAEIFLRFKVFFASFRVVMGAQILISFINSAATGCFLLIAGFPHAITLTAITFACGLLPIVGNLISNAIIVCVGLSIPDKSHMSAIALVYLVVIHKGEYFLNSKIIGSRIKNPMWLTLIGLLIGERLMGVPGMILAPVILHYIKVEMSKARVAAPAGAEASEAPRSPDI